MSKIAEFLQSKGLEITKDAKYYVRVKLEEVDAAVLKNTIDLLKDFDIDKEKSFFHSDSNQLYIYSKIVPIIKPKSLDEIAGEGISEIVAEILSPEIPEPEIPIPEGTSSEEIKDEIDDSEEIVKDLDEQSP